MKWLFVLSVLTNVALLRAQSHSLGLYETPFTTDRDVLCGLLEDDSWAEALPSWRENCEGDLTLSDGDWPYVSLEGRRIVGLLLNNLHISGTLPSIIGRLRYLQSLDLSQNSFSGQLPPAWGELKKLEVISLSSNQELEGFVPGRWGLMNQLKYLFTADTKIRGLDNAFLDGSKSLWPALKYATLLDPPFCPSNENLRVASALQPTATACFKQDPAASPSPTAVTSPTMAPSPSSIASPTPSASFIYRSPPPPSYVHVNRLGIMEGESTTLVVGPGISDANCSASPRLRQGPTRIPPFNFSQPFYDGYNVSYEITALKPELPLPGRAWVFGFTCKFDSVGPVNKSTTTMLVVYAVQPPVANASLLGFDGLPLPTVSRLGFSASIADGNALSVFAPHRLPRFDQATFDLFEGMSFTVDIQGFVAGIPIPTQVGPNSTAVHLTLPSWEEVCLHGGQSCTGEEAYKPLTLVETVVFNNGTTELNSSKVYSCPPNCPGGGKGIYYAQRCQSFQSGAVCFDPKTAQQCGFGEGTLCEQCPVGAFCPGGPRAWPQPGYWAADENQKSLMECAPPAALRCTGWSIELNAVRCGPGYRQSSPQCSACDIGYYEEDGACKQCPVGKAAVRVAVIPLVATSTALLSTLFLIWIILSCSFRKAQIPATRFRIFRIALDFIVWCVVMMQVLAQVGKSSSPGISPLLRQAFTALQLLQFDAGGVDPVQCDSGYPFIRPLLLFIICNCFGMSSMACSSRCCRRSFCGDRANSAGVRWFRYMVLLGCVLLYPVVSSTVFDMVKCSSLENSTGEMVEAWHKNPDITCYGAEHMPVAVLAWASFVLFVLGLPMWLFYIALMIVRREYRKEATQRTVNDKDPEAVNARMATCCHKLSKKMPCFWVHPATHRRLRTRRPWSPLFGYGQPWFRPTHLSFLALISLFDTLLDAPGVSMQVGRRVATGTLIVIMILLVSFAKPDHEWTRWKRWPRLVVMFVALSTVLLQLSLTVDAARYLSEAQASALSLDDATSQEGFVSALSLSSDILNFVVIALGAASPLVLIVSFIVYLNTLFGQRGPRCCRGCRCSKTSLTSKDHSNRPRTESQVDLIRESSPSGSPSVDTPSLSDFLAEYDIMWRPSARSRVLSEIDLLETVSPVHTPQADFMQVPVLQLPGAATEVKPATPEITLLNPLFRASNRNLTT